MIQAKKQFSNANPKVKQDLCFIYAIMRNGKALYVGQTREPWKRKWNHLHGRFKGCKFVVLKKCKERQAAICERATIISFKAVGLCKYNQVVPRRRKQKIFDAGLSGKTVTFKSIEYSSISRCARAHGVCIQTIKKYILLDYQRLAVAREIQAKEKK